MSHTSTSLGCAGRAQERLHTQVYRGVRGHAPIALWVIPVGDLGGVARHVLDVARVGLPRTRMVVMCPAGPLSGRLEELGIPVLVEDFGPEAGLRASVASLRHAIATLRPAVVHTHLAYADIVAALAVPLTSDIRLVSTEHGIAAPGHDAVYHGTGLRGALTHHIMATAHRLRCERYDALIAVSESTAQAMHATWHPHTPIRVILNGMPQVQEPHREPGLRILSLARLAPEKRIDMLLQAFSIVHRDHPEAHLTVAGSGPLREQLGKVVDVLGLQDAVSFPGFVSATEALAEHDVLAQLSAWENCSYSLLDAASAGLGVVATPVGGNPEIVPAQCLVEAEDPRQVAAALVAQGLDLSQRPGLRPQWPTISDMAEQIVEVYRGCRS